MQVETLTKPEGFELLRDEWRALVPQSQADLIFSTWEWHWHWWHAYCPGELLIVTVRTDARELVGLLPLFVEEQPEVGHVARIIGSDDVTDYLDVIAHVGHLSAVYEALATYVKGSDAFDVLDLSNIREESPTKGQFADALTAAGMTVTVEPQEVCPLFEVPATFDAYYDILDSKQRSELRRKLRRAEGAEDLQWYIVDGTHNLEDELDKFLKLMASSHPDKAAFLQNAQHVAFFRSFMPVAMANNWLQLVFQTYEDEPIAAYLNFDYNDDILVYNSGLNPDKYGALSPGIVLLANTIRWAIEHHKRTFNFLRGNETYKYQMGGYDTIVYKLRAVRP